MRSSSRSTFTDRSAAASIAGARSATQDYDLRATQQLGAGVITVEGFEDAYNYNEQKGPQVPTGVATVYGPGPNYLDLYHNRGYLISDDFATSKNDLAFGYTWLHQANTDGAFPYTTASGQTANVFGVNPQLDLATASYFVRDSWSPSNKFSVFGSFWLQRSLDTSSTHFDPRLSFVYRPDNSDVFRLTGGKSYSEPDPSLLAFTPPIYGAPSSINCPSTTTGTGSLISIAWSLTPTSNRKRPTISKPHTATASASRRTSKPTSISRGKAKRSSAAWSRSLGYRITRTAELIAQYLSRRRNVPG